MNDDVISRQVVIDAVQSIERLATLPDNDAVVRMSAVEYVLYHLPSVQPNLQPTCNNLATDCISRQAAIDLWEQYHPYIAIKACEYDAKLRRLPSVQPEQKTCEGCKHSGQWENELEYGASCPCLVCKRRASDNYERSD